ncbi:hypothetical protein AB0K51_20775 [Kitasatospora sp. NPDC049285]|uniref:hypothetical protein n=1 Tax=Kitasatospora sp. NPDC049285 TaxID=3157096 RepID=UPI0034433457
MTDRRVFADRTGEPTGAGPNGPAASHGTPVPRQSTALGGTLSLPIELSGAVLDPAAVRRAFGTAYGPPDPDGHRAAFAVLAYLAPVDRYLIAPLGARPGGTAPSSQRCGWAEPAALDELVVAHPIRTQGGARSVCHHHIRPAAPGSCRTCSIRPPRPDCGFFRTSRYAPIPEEGS